MTLRELVFICLDELKLSASDDSFFNENHVRFLLNKWRARLLKQEYDNNKNKKASESAYQTICLDLEDNSPLGNDVNCGETFRRSTTAIPPMLQYVGDPILSAGGIFSNDRIVYVSRQRMRKWSGRYAMNFLLNWKILQTSFLSLLGKALQKDIYS